MGRWHVPTRHRTPPGEPSPVKSDWAPLSILRALIGRPLDYSLVIVIAVAADHSGKLITTIERLARLVTVDGLGHGVPSPKKPSHDAVRRALRRLEGVPGDRRFPRVLWVDVERRGREAVGLKFQLAYGVGAVRPKRPGQGPAAGPHRTANPAMARVSGRSSNAAAGPAAGYSVKGSFIKENAREAPVDKVRGRERMREIRRELRQRQADQK